MNETVFFLNTLLFDLTAIGFNVILAPFVLQGGDDGTPVLAGLPRAVVSAVTEEADARSAHEAALRTPELRIARSYLSRLHGRSL